MNEEKDMRMLIEEDLRHSQEIWESYSHDKEKLGELFQLLLQHYDGEIDGFDEDLWVIQDREDCADMAEVYRKNIRHLMERLEAFRHNGYSNERLMEDNMRKEQKDNEPACKGKRRNHDEAGRNGRNLCPSGSQKQKVGIPQGIPHLGFRQRSRCSHGDSAPVFPH